MIVGVGHDVADMERFESILGGKTAERFMMRILTEQEREVASRYEGKRLVQYVSGRFAAKEAVVKALGCGIGGTVGFEDIAIVPDANGKPLCALKPEAWERLGLNMESHKLHVTITHDKAIASAVAIAECLSV
ncbi:holo-ACP synthase [Paenibacillus protaetiae]|uniref:Holo-[acyl-carrier-protein] synthase n=1 Tax=Paenibacillus protaetiae TaxID=2509456 RepID=A0A4P6EXF3_9BACL|nr:holo-ACP synthase [Paenibacillus protaetiae]QAY68090.1 holo-[acyl-carrier-protein] synthase [Paenibacillus protaetiae]